MFRHSRTISSTAPFSRIRAGDSGRSESQSLWAARMVSPSSGPRERYVKE